MQHSLETFLLSNSMGSGMKSKHTTERRPQRTSVAYDNDCDNDQLYLAEYEDFNQQNTSTAYDQQPSMGGMSPIGDSSGDYLCNSRVNYLRHGNYSYRWRHEGIR